MIKNIEKSNEIVAINDKEIAILKEHFPTCFKNDGSFDIERFKETLKDKLDVVHEGYELKFLGKSYAKLLASLDTTTVITPNEEHNSQPENTNSENIYISGDNLDGLKHLLKSYAKSVKCIYIDPPYNTGSDGFVYKDNFNFTTEELQDKLSVDENQANRILELTQKGSASHSAWLMFMYSRLQLAKDLLKDDGVIFISIDDNEQANLKLLCDDIFGEENFVSNIIWEKKYSPQNDAKWFSPNHDYILLYSKSKEIYRPIQLKRTPEQLARYKNPDNDPRGVWKMSDLSVKTYSPEYDYPIITPSGRVAELPSGRCWMTNETKMKELISDNRIWFGKDGNNIPALKRFLSEVKDGVTPMTIWNRKEVGDNQEGKQELLKIMPENVFQTPKPIRLLKKILSVTVDKSDYILDFFSGSASTAHAVLEYNNENKSNLKFISVQLPETLNQKDSTQKTAFELLKSNNYPPTLDYIGFERIKRASKKIKEETNSEIDYGFKHFILNEPNPNTLDKCETFDKANLIANDSILDDFGVSTVLTTWLNYDGYGLTTKATEIDLKGYTAYYHQKHLYLIHTDFTQEAVMELFEKYDTIPHFNPENIVLFGYSFNEWSVTEMLEKNLKILNDTEKNLKINIEVRY
ncbi:site-specific DNA-methyltransferase [Flavobacterium sp. TP390]|uniref:site-specific DNA-methyltransferase (adenine-specific) n=1 Tax=Flavobacterium profundi TaxID=1774945 RepID=A0A6I4IE91_9FLAO|nr:site-specific DNA-methyltransferase [Flavobacterium profundi]MVO07993.1 site-specific DNA-methyltransferase [Flavobacterium profundi]